MAENGNLSNNNNKLTTTTPATVTATTITSLEEQGITESDAIYQRIRNDLDRSDITCLSCYQTFEKVTRLEIYEHYSEYDHPNFYRNCLYCQGKVHQYRHLQTQRVHIYHNCLRWKRGEDK